MSEPFELTLTDIANGGQALGRYGGKTIFVPYCIPGEVITAQIVDDRGKYAFAEGVSVLSPSADRVLPRCPHFGLNGCCSHWQHIDYPAQLALKTDIVIDQLSRIGGFDEIEVPLALASPLQWGYSHAAVLYPAADGRLGFRQGENQPIIPVTECHLITPDLLALLSQLDFELDTLTQVKILDNGQDDRMVVLSTTDDEAPSLEVDFKASVNFLLSDNEPANLIGSTHLMYTLLGRQYRVTAGCFMRNNLAQIETLIGVIQSQLKLRGQESLLDLYSGSGILAGALADQTSLITCVDSYPPAMTDAEANLKEFDHIDLLEGDVAEVLDNLENEYQAAVLDPPGTGLTKEVVDALVDAGLPRLIYVSENPATLARDARRLVDRGGYKLETVQPIDFEPQTYRIVSVACLTKE